MIIPAVIFALVLGIFVFSALPRAGVARRVATVGVFVTLIAVVYGGGVEVLGRAKPMRLEWRDATEAQVVGAVPVENEGIYVWLSMPGSPQPIAYVLPWSLKDAEQLQTAMSKAEADGTAVQMTWSTDASRDESKPMFYALPQPALPLKDYQSRRIVYQNADRNS